MSPVASFQPKDSGQEIPKGSASQNTQQGREGLKVDPVQKPKSDNKIASLFISWKKKKIIIGGKNGFLEASSITFVYKKSVGSQC